jgi:hypothetical protein
MLRRFIFTYVLLAAFAVTAEAAGRVVCKGEKFQFATSTSVLPPDVLASLRNPEGRFEDLAEYGAPFYATDVVGAEVRPMRRLGAVAIGSKHIFVAVEHGGMGYYVEIWSFELQGTQWHGFPDETAVHIPSTLPEILYLTCDRYPRPPKRKEPEQQVGGAATPDGSIILSLSTVHSAGLYKLNRRIVDQGTDKYNEITDELHGDRPLTTDERLTLKSDLRALAKRMRKNDSAYKFVEEYMRAIGGN